MKDEGDDGDDGDGEGDGNQNEDEVEQEDGQTTWGGIVARKVLQHPAKLKKNHLT